MAIDAATALWFLPFALPISIWVAFNDMKYMKIPNVAVMALLIGFLAVGLIALPLAEYGWRLLAGVIVLVVGFFANMVRLVGAGDAKFAAAMAPFFAPGDYGLAAWLLAGLVIAAVVTHRIAARIKPLRSATADWQSWDNKDFPMGLALGGLLAAYLIAGVFAG